MKKKAVYQSPITKHIAVSSDCYMLHSASTNGAGFGTGGGSGKVG